MFKITRILTSYEWGGIPDAGNPFLAPWRRPIIDSMINIQTISSSILILSGTNRSWILLGSRHKYSTAAWLSNILCMVMVTFLALGQSAIMQLISFILSRFWFFFTVQLRLKELWGTRLRTRLTKICFELEIRGSLIKNVNSRIS